MVQEGVRFRGNQTTKPQTPYMSLNANLTASPPPENGKLMILAVYMGMGLLLVGTYVWGVVVLQRDYPKGNSRNPEQKGAAYLWGSIFDSQVLLKVYYLGFVL